MKYTQARLEMKRFGMPYRCVIFFGAPGSGKGTQAKALAQHIPSFHLCLGDHYRRFHRDSPFGRYFNSYAREAKPIPDTFATEVCLNYIKASILVGDYNPLSELLLLDGFPKSSNQFAIIGKYFSVIAVMHLTCSEELSLMRVNERQNNLGRDEDRTLQLIRTRMFEYRTRAYPLLAKFIDAGVPVCDIEGNREPALIAKDIRNHYTSLIDTDEFTFVSHQKTNIIS